MLSKFAVLSCIIGASLLLPSGALAQSPLTTAFTYQGELKTGGSAANGLYDFQFVLFDSTGAQIGSPVCRDNVTVTSGRFTTSLDFGAQFGGLQRFLEIRVRADTGLNCTNLTGFTTLSPRQELTAAPNALFASSATSATNATQLNGQAASFYQNATNVNAGTLANTRTTGTNLNAVNTLVLRDASGNFSAGTITGTFSGTHSGDGSGLTNLTAANVSGILANAHTSGQSGNVPSALVLRDAGGNFSAGTITGTFSGNGSSLTNLSASTILSGTLNDARLSTNVPLLNISNVFSAGVNRFKEVNVDTSDANDGTFVAGLLRFGSAGSGEGIASNRTSDANGNRFGLDFYTNNGAKRMSITIDGKVGIGTVAPDMSLEVRGPGTFYGRPTMGVSDGVHYVYLLADGTLDPSIVWDAPTALRFGTETSRGTGYVEHMRITDDGRVGIGTASPQGLFQVAGPARIDIPPSSPSNFVAANGATQTFVSVASAELASITLRTTGIGYGGNILTVTVTGPGVSAAKSVVVGAFQSRLVTFAFDAPRPVLVSGQTYTWTFTHQQVGETLSINATNPYPQGQSSVSAGSDFECAIVYATGATEAGLVVTSDGFVGVGTAFPTSSLTVAGNVSIIGSLSKGGGSFKIDHPLDPENQFLYHSFVESPDMKNIYDGVVTTDANGYATITLPDYFEALNRDFRYQLTVIDENDDMDIFLWAKVVREVKGNAFTIRSNRGGVKVSWQVTGIRHDAWADKNRIPNAVEKIGTEKSRYLHPEVFGKPAEQGIYSAPAPSAAAPPR